MSVPAREQRVTLLPRPGPVRPDTPHHRTWHVGLGHRTRIERVTCPLLGVCPALTPAPWLAPPGNLPLCSVGSFLPLARPRISAFFASTPHTTARGLSDSEKSFFLCNIFPASLCTAQETIFCFLFFFSSFFVFSFCLFFASAAAGTPWRIVLSGCSPWDYAMGCVRAIGADVSPC